MLCGYPPFYGDSDQEVLDEARSLEAEKVVESTTWCPRCVREK